MPDNTFAKKNKAAGLLLVLLSGMVLGLMPVLKKGCVDGGANNALLLVSRFFFLSLAVLPLALRDGGLKKALRDNIRPLLLLVLTEGPTPIMLYASFDHLSSGLAMTIHFIYPVIVTLCCVLFFREKLSPGKILCLVMCLAGVFLTADLSGGATGYAGVVFSLISAFTYAGYIVLLGKSKFRNITPIQIAFFVGVGCCLVACVYALFCGTADIIGSVTPKGWLSLAVSGIVIAVGGSLCFIIGARIVDSQVTAISSTLEPLTSVIVGVLFMAEPMNIRIAAGCLLILAAVVLLSVFTAREGKTQEDAGKKSRTGGDNGSV